jgi:hypothetical protein
MIIKLDILKFSIRFFFKPMLCLINIISSFYSAYELLYDVTITPRQYYGIKDKPKGLIVIHHYYINNIKI